MDRRFEGGAKVEMDRRFEGEAKVEMDRRFEGGSFGKLVLATCFDFFKKKIAKKRDLPKKGFPKQVCQNTFSKTNC